MVKRAPVVVFLMRKESPVYYSIERLFESIKPFLAERFEVRIVHVPCHSRGLLRCLRNLLFTARVRADIIHVTGDIYYCSLAVWPRRCVLTIHDLCSLSRLRGARRYIFSSLWYALPLRWARYVTAISEETKKQLIQRYPAAASKIELIPNCVDVLFEHVSPLPTANNRPSQILQVGTGANKNLERVAVAASALPLHLRIIGPLTPNQRNLLQSLKLSWSSAEGLQVSELVEEYLHSSALVFASTYEGFGLPIVEAQAMGLPVITSNIAPMTETAGAGALFVDPYNKDDIRKAIEKVLTSPCIASDLRESGRRNAERFRATTVASRYADLYDQALVRANLQAKESDNGTGEDRDHVPSFRAKASRLGHAVTSLPRSPIKRGTET